MSSEAKRAADSQPTFLQFDDNSLLPMLFGEHDQNLARLERQLGVSIASRGNQVAVTGPEDAVTQTAEALNALYARLQKGMAVNDAEVDAAVRMSHAGQADAGGPGVSALTLITRKRHITPRSPRQAAFIKSLLTRELVFGIGPAGTGKTYLAVATAVAMLVQGQVERIILSRPAVEAGERLGFLPGDLKEKVDPYLRPLYDALHDMMPGEQVNVSNPTGREQPHGGDRRLESGRPALFGVLRSARGGEHPKEHERRRLRAVHRRRRGAPFPSDADR